MTISLYSTVNNALFKMVSMSVSYPLVRKRSDFSTRRGVSRRPSRATSSPSSASSVRMVSCMLAFYLAVGAGLAAAAPRVGQAPATSPDPDVLYAARADLAKAKEAEDIWQ